MICFETDIHGIALDFFKERVSILPDYVKANQIIKEICGICNFFDSQNEAEELLINIRNENPIVSECTRREYGDFQTNNNLAIEVTEYASLKYPNIEFVLEPTCGKGNFILAAIKSFRNIKKIVGVEIFHPYIWETKLKILSFYLENSNLSKPEIDIIHEDAFQYNYYDLADSTRHLKTLIIGNPPWVTNSELGTINSKNLPQKSNFKQVKGFEARTGKGNFDLGEYISLNLIRAFQKHNGLFAFLIKNSVVKNLISSQNANQFTIGNIEMLNIDSKKEFNVSVNASLFVTSLNTSPDFTCDEYDFYTGQKSTTFGWYKDKFVYSIDDYDSSSCVDGKSPFVWRSGVKHDCSKIMEFDKVGEFYRNSLGENIHLEHELVYNFLKSSDLKDFQANTSRKFTLITQNKVGQDTRYIKEKFPLTYSYLNSHRESFVNRKSSIYVDKPEFSIFGIGEYSFKKYKIAVSGLYKSTHFTLVLPETKPIMLDDTCYFIGFDNFKMASIAHFLLNSDVVQKFLKSIIFSDAKRPINKDNLMRIDLIRVYNQTNFIEAKANINGLTEEDWKAFKAEFEKKLNNQIQLF